MSERRQFALFVVGLVALAAVGFVSATLFPEPCEGLVEVGELPLAFTDAADALPLSGEDAAAVQRVGEQLGVGPWRGAVALPDDALVMPSEFGFFVVGDAAFTVLRPSMGLVSAGRSRSGLEVVPTGTSLALRAADGRTGVYNGEYEQERCGSLPPDAEVLSLDRGIAVLEDGSDVRAVTLSGNELFGGSTADVAHVADDAVVLGEGADLELVDSRGGEVLDRVTGPPGQPATPWISAAGDRLLVRVEGGVRPVVVEDDALVWQPVVRLPLAPASDLQSVTTPAGIVAAGAPADGGGSSVAGLVTDRSDRFVPLPSTVAVQSLHASADGYVGVAVTVDGARALLVYGRDAEGRGTTE
jgi:hypothetical protein